MQGSNWLYTYILPLAPSALTIAGWVIISYREKNKKLSERKSKRIETAAAIAFTIQEKAIAYYCNKAEGSEAEAHEITFQLKHLARLCAKISPDLDQEIVKLRISVSGGNFQSKQRQPIHHHHETIFKIRQDISDLVIKLDNFHDN